MSRSTTESSGVMSLRCHVGGTLYNLARFYPTLATVLDELIQNALDAKASKVQLKVNLKTRFVAIRDNGEGISRDDFDKRVSRSIGRSIKSKDDLGQFGIGFISPVGKCEFFEVTSCPSDRKTKYTTWRFQVDVNKEEASTPWRDRDDLIFAPDGGGRSGRTSVWWRTAIEISNIVDDKAFSEVSLGGIVDSALQKFSAKMEKLGTRLRVDFIDRSGKESSREVTAATFTGGKLPEFTHQGKSSGEVVVRMYLAKRHGSRINVKLGQMGNDFRFPFSNFKSSAAKNLLSEDVMEALASGIFEGEILGENVKLSPSRTCFEKNDALLDLCIAIEEWFEKQGRQYLNQERRERKKERYQGIGREALSRIEHLLQQDSCAELRNVLRHLQHGTLGRGHTEKPSNGRVGKTQDEPSLSPQGGAEAQSKNGRNGRKRSDPEKEQDRPHFSARGPKGSRRKAVKGGSFGLQIAFDELPDSPNLWELDTEEGCIVFNTMHPDWVQLDKGGTSDWRLRALMENVALQVLTLLSMPDPAWSEVQRLFADELTKHLVQWLSHGGGTYQRGKKKK